MFKPKVWMMGRGQPHRNREGAPENGSELELGLYKKQMQVSKRDWRRRQWLVWGRWAGPGHPPLKSSGAVWSAEGAGSTGRAGGIPSALLDAPAPGGDQGWGLAVVGPKAPGLGPGSHGGAGGFGRQWMLDPQAW